MSDFVSYTAAEEALIVCLINSVGSVTYLSIGQCSLCSVRVRLAALHQQQSAADVVYVAMLMRCLRAAEFQLFT